MWKAAASLCLWSSQLTNASQLYELGTDIFALNAQANTSSGMVSLAQNQLSEGVCKDGRASGKARGWSLEGRSQTTATFPLQQHVAVWYQTGDVLW